MTSPLDRVAALALALEEQTQELRSQVAAARRENCSWAAIAAALGVSKQAAHHRFAPRQRNIEDLPLSDPLFDPLFSNKD